MQIYFFPSKEEEGRGGGGGRRVREYARASQIAYCQNYMKNRHLNQIALQHSFLFKPLLQLTSGRRKKTLIINSKNPRSFPDNGKIPVKLLGSRRDCLALFLWVTCQFYWCYAVMMREQGSLCCGCPQRQHDGQQSAFCDSRKYPLQKCGTNFVRFSKTKEGVGEMKNLFTCTCASPVPLIIETL